MTLGKSHLISAVIALVGSLAACVPCASGQAPALSGYVEFDGVNLGGVVTEVYQGGLAERVGIRPQDRILTVNGQPFYSLEEYQRIAAAGNGQLVLLVQSGVTGRRRVVDCSVAAPPLVGVPGNVVAPIGRPLPVAILWPEVGVPQGGGSFPNAYVKPGSGNGPVLGVNLVYVLRGQRSRFIDSNGDREQEALRLRSFGCDVQMVYMPGPSAREPNPYGKAKTLVYSCRPMSRFYTSASQAQSDQAYLQAYGFATRIEPVR